MLKKIVLLFFSLFLAFNIVQRLPSNEVKSETINSPISAVPTQTPFPDAYNAHPTGWTGRVFKLSQNYPTVMPLAENYPWKRFNFKTQPVQYLNAVLRYALEGNIQQDFDVRRNTVRKWYHAPNMHINKEGGREFIRGLTKERTSEKFKLHPNQNKKVQNWAVSFYNAPGGFIIGKVWTDHENPKPQAAIFPEGSVAIKLLFTQADKNLVPYLAGSLVWEADIFRKTTTVIKPQKLHLLQIDIAVRDTDADATTGWVFGTFIYNANRPGATVWDKLVPIGLMYGNDPTKYPFSADSNLIETVYNPNLATEKPAGYNQFQGFNGRLNGPVDNPKSSCLSCHSTSQIPKTVIPIAQAGQEPAYFRNIKAGEPFSPMNISLDYSLQLQVGLGNFTQEKRIEKNNFTILPDFFPIGRDGTIIKGIKFFK